MAKGGHKHICKGAFEGSPAPAMTRNPPLLYTAFGKKLEQEAVGVAYRALALGGTPLGEEADVPGEFQCSPVPQNPLYVQCVSEPGC